MINDDFQNMSVKEFFHHRYTWFVFGLIVGILFAVRFMI